MAKTLAVPATGAVGRAFESMVSTAESIGIVSRNEPTSRERVSQLTNLNESDSKKVSRAVDKLFSRLGTLKLQSFFRNELFF
jgi:NAD dependent epimerase/dehydratase family enzyme